MVNLELNNELFYLIKVIFYKKLLHRGRRNSWGPNRDGRGWWFWDRTRKWPWHPCRTFRRCLWLFRGGRRRRIQRCSGCSRLSFWRRKLFLRGWHRYWGFCYQWGREYRCSICWARLRFIFWNCSRVFGCPHDPWRTPSGWWIGGLSRRFCGLPPCSCRPRTRGCVLHFTDLIGYLQHISYNRSCLRNVRSIRTLWPCKCRWLRSW